LNKRCLIVEHARRHENPEYIKYINWHFTNVYIFINVSPFKMQRLWQSICQF